MFIVSDNDVDIIFVTILIPDKGIEGQHLIKPLFSVQFNSILEQCFRRSFFPSGKEMSIGHICKMVKLISRFYK